MANPSLQIGNSNWAIKEDNLLGYSTAGTRFLPQPITMTRASAGTRVNSSGLIETVELLGSELITDGDFALTGTQAESTTGTYWSTGASWTIANNIATYGGVGEPYLNNLNAVNIQVGQTFIFTFTLNSDAKLRFVNEAGARFQGTWVVYAQGTHTVYITSGISATLIGIQADTNNGSFGVSNVSVKESTKNNLARVDYDGTASSLLVEPERTNDITNSETFGSTGWSQVTTGTAITPIVTDNYAISPDGTQNAQRIQFNLGGSSPSRTVIRQSISTQTDWFLSVYMKSTDGTDQKILWHSTSDTNETTVTADWKRFTFSRNGFSNSWAGLCLNGGVSTVNTADILVYGFQAEQGSYATSYIPTSGLTVTRVKDQYEKTGISNLINSEEGVLFVEMAALSESGGNGQIQLRDAASANVISIQLETGIIKARSKVSNVSIGATLNYTTPIVSSNKIAIMWTSLGVFTFWINGFLRGTVTHGTTFSSGVLTNVNFDSASTYFFEGKVKQLQVYKTALTDTELATLTTI
jgi:hypothetical protein